MCVVSILFNLKIEFSDLKSKMDVKMAVIVITIDLVLSSGFTSVYEPVNFSMFHLLLLFSYRFYCVDVFVFFTLPLSLTGSYTKDELSSFKDVWFVYFNFLSATIKTTSKKTSCTTLTYSPNRRLELTWNQTQFRQKRTKNKLFFTQLATVRSSKHLTTIAIKYSLRRRQSKSLVGLYLGLSDKSGYNAG